MDYDYCKLYYNIKEEINQKRENLNKLVNDGIDDKVIELSQELDMLISEYLMLEMILTKK
ncbi:aspartyl-phosphate phosphatase Spo0E family protein [Tissierella sp. Yu-01]|uniref:aspartyl-phosphate phosphatase Spo0E family protein n=1 Tax=Tissierella sp. Yu-01 TaxID=3035694 RepID=UPI00240D1CF8|nr:aspartyl-phosphate phosphatase Spo0E family protein [Tissierella sp. Yu-01]WFA10275.1 aspartyl-phosphate phosphatase Spo0E family protein [Tissierella sp. Yu-01]